MAYYSGTASSLADLRTALLTHAQTDGWVLTGDVLSKAGVYFQIQVNATNVTCLGCESNAVANPAPGVVSIGRIFVRTGYTTREISFPCNYEVFGFSQELYLVANYDVDSYQWMAFGKSTVPGLPGQGGWCGATLGELPPVTYYATDAIIIATDMSGNNDSTTAALFFFQGGDGGVYAHQRNCWINSGLDAQGWFYDSTVDSFGIGIKPLLPLLSMQPSTWNSESVLLPLRSYRVRPAYKSSLTVDLENARHFRIDNHAPGDILTLGADKWKAFPWYRKNIIQRNGSNNVRINHSGTFGWAIRYEGP